MKKRPIIICLVVLVLGSVIFWLQSNYIITGWLNGEAFYQGRSTSYWRQHLADVYALDLWDNHDEQRYSRILFFRVKSSLPGGLDSVIGNRALSTADLDFLQDHPLLIGDPAAREVLSELTIDSTDTISNFAKRGLERINQECPPTSK